MLQVRYLEEDISVFSSELNERSILIKEFNQDESKLKQGSCSETG